MGTQQFSLCAERLELTSAVRHARATLKLSLFRSFLIAKIFIRAYDKVQLFSFN